MDWSLLFLSVLDSSLKKSKREKYFQWQIYQPFIQEKVASLMIISGLLHSNPYLTLGARD